MESTGSMETKGSVLDEFPQNIPKPSDEISLTQLFSAIRNTRRSLLVILLFCGLLSGLFFYFSPYRYFVQFNLYPPEQKDLTNFTPYVINPPKLESQKMLNDLVKSMNKPNLIVKYSEKNENGILNEKIKSTLLQLKFTPEKRSDDTIFIVEGIVPNENFYNTIEDYAKWVSELNLTQYKEDALAAFSQRKEMINKIIESKIKNLKFYEDSLKFNIEVAKNLNLNDTILKDLTVSVISNEWPKYYKGKRALEAELNALKSNTEGLLEVELRPLREELNLLEKATINTAGVNLLNMDSAQPVSTSKALKFAGIVVIFILGFLIYGVIVFYKGFLLNHDFRK